MNEYSIKIMHCEHLERVPGNMYQLPENFGVYCGPSDNMKCMKCVSCGDSRPMTKEEEIKYASWYKRIES